MKQHITVKQLYEVDDAKLSKLINDETFSINSRDLNSIYCNDRCGPTTYEAMAKIVTIGKMIEILESEDLLITINVSLQEKSVMVGNRKWGKPFIEKELCDALWKAVKYLIK